MMASLIDTQKTELEPILYEAKKNLGDSGANLQNVADYCEINYVQSEDKHAAFQETKEYVTQSIASVAYQLDLLAFNFIKNLEAQDMKLNQMTQDVNSIAQMVKIREEKAARQRIGHLATSKESMKSYKIVAPTTVEKPNKYYRKPIDYSELDHIGNGKPQRRLSSGSHNNSWHMAESIGNLSAISKISDPLPKLMSYDQFSGRGGISRGSLTSIFEGAASKVSTLRKGASHVPLVLRTRYGSSSSIESSQSSINAKYSRIFQKSSSPLKVPNVCEKVTVVYEYQAEKEDELELKEGAIIGVIHKNDDGWWEGVDDQGRRGLFPSNYVEQLL